VNFSPNSCLPSKPKERVLREVGTCCHEQYTVWAELIPFIERWLNITVGGLTGYTPVEMMLIELRPDILEDNFSKSCQTLPEERL